MASFPTLSSGQTVQYPLRRTVSFRTLVVRFNDDTEQRYAARPPLTYLQISLRHLTATDRNLITTFWQDQRGALTADWDINVGGTVYSRCTFNTDMIEFEESDWPERYSLTLDLRQTANSNFAPGALTTFPILRTSNARFQRPYKVTQRVRVSRVDHPDSGVHYASALNETTHCANSHAGLYAWQIDYQLTPAEAATLETHFLNAQGRLLAFAFTDPSGVTHDHCRYGDDDLSLLYRGPNDTAVTVHIEEEA